MLGRRWRGSLPLPVEREPGAPEFARGARVYDRAVVHTRPLLEAEPRLGFESRRVGYFGRPQGLTAAVPIEP